MAAANIQVSGIVQGVGYRYWTSRNAGELGIAGWVRNLDDGRVEIHAEGDVDRIDELVRRCRRGPRSADVTGVVRSDAAPTGAASFEIRRG